MVDFTEQFSVVPDILLVFFHHFYPVVFAGDWVGVCPLGCWDKLCLLPANINVLLPANIDVLWVF